MLPALRNGSTLATAGIPVNRLIDDFFNGRDPLRPLIAPSRPALPLAMWEDEDLIYVEVDLPGVMDQDVDVSLHQGELCVSGERKRSRQGEGWDSRSYGRFEQRISLPVSVDADKVDAKLTHGVLRLSIPKSEQAKPRRIAVKAE